MPFFKTNYFGLKKNIISVSQAFFSWKAWQNAKSYKCIFQPYSLLTICPFFREEKKYYNATHIIFNLKFSWCHRELYVKCDVFYLFYPGECYEKNFLPSPEMIENSYVKGLVRIVKIIKMSMQKKMMPKKFMNQDGEEKKERFTLLFYL